MVYACFRQPRIQNFLRRPTMVADLFYATPSSKPRSAHGGIFPKLFNLLKKWLVSLMYDFTF